MNILNRLLNRDDERKLTILHFNDVYDITDDRAAKFVTCIKKYENPLVLFSGDCYSPSLMSVITKGAQMPPILNAIGVKAACFGNHEFDWGLPRCEELCEQCNFPWLMSNCWVKETGKTLGDGERSVLLEHGGVKIGLIGLIEREWLASLSTMEESELEWRDAIDVAKELSVSLRARGAEIVIALTHMRQHNDERLLQQSNGVLDLILGGHDHHFEHVTAAGEDQPRLLKSGTDFRELSEALVHIGSSGRRTGSPGTGTTDKPPPSCVRIVGVRRVEVSADVAPDAETKALVASFERLMNSKMDGIVGATAVGLDARFKTIRSAESNVSNFVADVLREGAGAQLAILNCGTLRADRILGPGTLTMRDLVSLLPMADQTIVVSVDGAAVLSALENGVSQWPKLDGRWPAVSALRFSFDPTKPAGRRIVPGSVYVQAEAVQAVQAVEAGAAAADADPNHGGASSDTVLVDQRSSSSTPPPPGYVSLDLSRRYTVATKAYLAAGKDGYVAFKDGTVAVDPDEAPMLPGLVRNHFVEAAARAGFRRGSVLSPAKAAKSTTHRWQPPGPSRLGSQASSSATTPLAPRSVASQTTVTSTTAAGGGAAAADMSGTLVDGDGEENALIAPKTPAPPSKPATDAASFVTPGAAGDDEKALLGAIHPVVEGRIVRVGE